MEIDRVEIVGVTLINESALERALEIGAGDRLVRSKVVNTAENFRALYRVVGYQEVRITSELIREKGTTGRVENVLRFVVVEGRPTRVASVRFVTNRANQELGGYWLEREQDLIERFGLKPGDVFNQEKISSGKRQLQDLLASEEFVGAKVEEVRVDTSSAPKLEKLEDAAGWVGITVYMDLGDRVTFGFRGNTRFSRGHLLTLVDEQRLLGFGNDYIGAIQGRIEQEYRSSGYAHVRITPFTFERSSQERHVTYEIEEGPKVRIESVEFEGNVMFDGNRLRRQFFSEAAPTIQNDIYVEKETQKASEAVVTWLREQGYLSAKLITINRIYGPKASTVRLIVYIYEGDQTQLESITITGLNAFSFEEVKSILSVEEDRPLNLFAFSEGLESLKAYYRSKGYLDMRIENESDERVVSYFQENRVARIRLELNEGPRYRLSRTEVEGLTKTREEVVMREIRLSPGDVLEEARIAESEARLRKLGIFSVVTTRISDDPEHADQKILRVSVQEGTPGLIAGGVGYRNDLGPRAFGEIAYTNLWNRNHTLSLGGSLNRRFDETFCDNHYSAESGVPPLEGSCCFEYQVQLGYSWPWFGLGETTFRPRLTIERNQYRILDAFTVSLALTWERRLLSDVNLIGLFTYSLERTQQRNAQRREDDNDLTIGAITPTIILDLRDSSLAPTRGFYGLASFEWASTAFLSQTGPPAVGYGRFQFRSDYLVPLPANIRWSLSFRMGYERNLEPPPDGTPDSERGRYQIPVIKQFTLGGIGSLRGFEEQELTVKRDVAILGSLSYVNYRTQIDFPLAGALQFGPFLDAGNLLVDEFSFGQLRFGAGAGLRYLSPVGPVNFDWGFKLNRQPSEPRSHVFHFSIGLI